MAYNRVKGRMVLNSGISSNYVEKVYAGWLGKVIGVRHGAPIENWTYDRLERTFGEMKTYLTDCKGKMFPADDDTNGPLFFLRALDDYTASPEITAEEMGLNVLNYLPDGHGFFWWGGFGISTEHTAYLNLKNGISAPRSGSFAQNGSTVAEQIGGQIFIDVWGLVAPGNPKLAAGLAAKMASVTHDGNGIYGGMFIAACIAQAFVESDVRRVIDAGLDVIPSDSEYARMTRDVIRFYEADQEKNWRACFRFVRDHYGYDKYSGVCHIIPNSAVIVLALLYSGGDFSDAVNIANMCGWDTDCNVGNVGSIMGVLVGVDGIDSSWRQPINDFLACSSVIGSLNIVDIPWCATYTASLGYRLAGTEAPQPWASIFSGEAARYHFELPGSTHAFQLSRETEGPSTDYIAHSVEAADEGGSGALKVVFQSIIGGNRYRAFVKTYYRPEDFIYNRYDPAFSPTLYPGQTVSASIMYPSYVGKLPVKARLYVKDGNSETIHYGSTHDLTADEWSRMKYTIPSLSNACLVEAGVEFFIGVKNFPNLVAFIDHFDFGGQPDYSINFAHEREEVWTMHHIEISQFTNLRGLWRLFDGELTGMHAGEPAECYTGDLQWRNYNYEGTLTPMIGEHHNIQFRVQGAIRSYAAGLAPGNRICLYKNNNGYEVLASAEYAWRHDAAYTISVEAIGNQFTVTVNGVELLQYTDEHHPYLSGQVGFSALSGSRTKFSSFSVRGLEEEIEQ